MNMKFSEAMREGAKRCGQAHQMWYRFDDDLERDCRCAANTAYWHVTGKDVFDDEMDETHEAIRKQFKLYAEVNPPKQFNDGSEYDLLTIVIALNDERFWPREKIADWLQGLGY